MKNILIGLLITVVFAVVAINFAGNVLVSNILTQALGVPVSVGKLALKPSQVGVYDIKISNPSGYGEKTLASIPEIFIDVNLAEILKKKAHVKQIRLNLDEITVERNKESKLNLAELTPVKQMTAKPQTSDSQAPAESSEQKKPAEAIGVQIDEVVFSLGRARYVDNTKEESVVREFPLEVKNESLKNVTDPAQVVQQITMKTLQKVGLNALMPDLDQFSSAFNTQAAQTLENVKQGFSGFMDKIKNQ